MTLPTVPTKFDNFVSKTERTAHITNLKSCAKPDFLLKPTTKVVDVVRLLLFLLLSNIMKCKGM